MAHTMPRKPKVKLPSPIDAPIMPMKSVTTGAHAQNAAPK